MSVLCGHVFYFIDLLVVHLHFPAVKKGNHSLFQSDDPEGNSIVAHFCLSCCFEYHGWRLFCNFLAFMNQPFSA